MSFWTSVTEPQATIIAAILTIVAAGVGVFIGSWLFGSRVTDLKQALNEAEAQLTNYRGQFELSVQKMASTLDEQVRAMQQSLGQIGTAIEDVRASTSAEDDEEITGEIDLMTRLRDRWTAIRDRMELIASSADVDGRTRAKYTRIDRRRYREFIRALTDDGRLGSNAHSFMEAYDIWRRYQRGNRGPSAEDSARMDALAIELLEA